MKAKKYLITILILVTGNLLNAQIQWSYHCGSNQVEELSGIITDDADNSYLAGGFQGDKIIFGNDTLWTSGINNAVLAKFNSSGNRLWVKRFSGTGFAVEGLHYDKTSNTIIIGGGFSSYIILGSDTLYNSNGGCFVSRIDTAGNAIWAKQFKAGLYLHTTDTFGNIYAVGYTGSVVSIDTLSIQPGVFIIKLDSNGNVLWAKKMFNVFGSFNNLWKVTPNALKVFNNEIYLAANTVGDTITVDTTNYFPLDSNSGALMKFTNDGNLIWMKTFGPDVFAQDVGIDAFGNCYLPGGFKGTIHFENDSISSQGVTINDGMYAKYDSTGHFQWVKQLHATGGAGFGKLAMNSDGNAYIIARMISGNAMFGNISITSSGTMSAVDNYVARYNSSGDCIGVEQLGITPGGGFGNIDRDNNDNAIATGFYQNSITLGSTTYGCFGGNDIAIAKLAAITGTHEGKAAHNQLLIYANPNQGKCNITVPDEFKNDKNLTLSIYANDGKLIQQKTLSMAGDKIKLNLEAEAKGLYNVSLSNGLKSYSGKIVFE